MALIISSLDFTKSVGPNSIPTKILKLLKINIPGQLVFKIAKDVPVHKKDSKLNFSIF